MINKMLFTSIFLLQVFWLHSQKECSAVSSSLWDDPWLSCQVQSNPNTSRGNSHWILYDLGKVYTLSSSWVWNVNNVSDLNSGFKNVVIDYSVDGSGWISLGISQFEKGTGANDYEGFDGPDFDKNNARYVLITAMSNWGDINCSGITEIRFNLTELNETKEININIPPTLFAMEVNTNGYGTAAVNANKVLFMKNDTATVTAMANNGYSFQSWSGDITSSQNPLTIHIDRHMQLTANFIQEGLKNCQSNELISSGMISTGDYIAKTKITSSGTIPRGSEILFSAGTEIELQGDFEVQSGATFLAQIKQCFE